MTAVRTIPFARPWITDGDRRAVVEVLQGDVLTHGPHNQAFEDEFARFVRDGAHCVAVSSCMGALHLAYLQLGIGPGDEVIVPAQTHVATAHAVEIVGARPVFVDCDPGTGNIDVEQIAALVTRRTKAIGLVHFLGIPCPMDEIMAVAQRHDLRVIEDCALALGARYRGRHVGLIGDAGCFSFYPAKHITTGEGGMFITRHRGLADKVRRARGFGMDRTFAERTMPGIYDVPALGLNYRMSDINAALGRQQLARIDENLTRRRTNFLQLKASLCDAEHLRVIDAAADITQSSHYCLSVVCTGPLAQRRSALVQRLNERGVGTSVYYPQPVPRMAYYRNKHGHRPECCKQAAIISDQSIALPIGPHLAGPDIAFIGRCVVETVAEMVS